MIVFVEDLQLLLLMILLFDYHSILLVVVLLVVVERMEKRNSFLFSYQPLLILQPERDLVQFVVLYIHHLLKFHQLINKL